MKQFIRALLSAIYFLLFMILEGLIICACNNQVRKPKSGDEGVLDQGGKVFFNMDLTSDDSSRVEWDLHDKVWYKGKTSIEEKRIMHTDTDPQNRTTKSYYLSSYLFRYPPTGMVYEYLTFSDTAKLLQFFPMKEVDSAALAGGNHYWGERSMHEYPIGPTVYLADTLVDGIRYKRTEQPFKAPNGIYYTYITFYRCDKPADLPVTEQINDSLSKELGCLAVKGWTISRDNRMKIFNTYELNFLADTLTEEEKRVFTAWEKNARANPVK